MLRHWAILSLIVVSLPAALPAAERVAPSDVAVPDPRQHTAAIDALLEEEMRLWYPRSVDRTHGGFVQSFDRNWSPVSQQNQTRSIVMQARHTWTTAAFSRHDPEQAEAYREMARHGLKYLEQRMWDAEFGGFFWEVDLSGTPTPRNGWEKHAYGQAFGIYAAAEVYRATRDPAALDLAQRAFQWLDKHAHEPGSGYIESLDRQGNPRIGEGFDALGTRIGGRSMNANIHLLEALTSLYVVWPDPLVRHRLEEVFAIVRDRIYVEPGCLNQFFTADWRPLPDGDSFGHDVETAFLLIEAADALGTADDPTTIHVARSLINHALALGWDQAHGGFFDEGSAYRPPTKHHKIWWVQAEGLNALMLAHHHWATDDSRYARAFDAQFRFIQSHLIDTRGGGWFHTVAADGSLLQPLKGSAWKGPYHSGRAMMNVGRLLKETNQVD